MHLVVFDIDGTLTRTNEADERCFESAVAQEFKISGVVTDWGAYTHSTDSGIIHELVERHHKRPPQQEELERFRETFVKHLENHYQDVPGSFDKVPGAESIFDRLKEMGTHAVAIATGGWKRSALLKLQKAGINISNIPSAFADDHFSRDDIILTAVTRAKEIYRRTSFESLTYVGDGRWDFLTATRLGINFVGITDNRGPEKLANAGAKKLTKDYSNPESFFNLLRL